MRGFVNAIGFLTIIKIPERYCYHKDFSPALAYFPLAGLAVGIMGAFFFWGFSFFLPIAVASVLAVGIEVVLTRGLHYDGLADVFDGFFSGAKGKDGVLEIMKKSDIGSFGVMAVVFMLLLKIALIYFLYTFLGANIWLFLAVLSFMPLWGRWSMVYLLKSHPPAKKEGSLAAMFSSVKNSRYLMVSSVYALVLFLGSVYAAESILGGPVVVCAGPFAGLVPILGPVLKAVIIFLAPFLVLMFLGGYFSKRLGGINGDILGACSIMVEVFYLFVSFLVFSYL